MCLFPDFNLCSYQKDKATLQSCILSPSAAHNWFLDSWHEIEHRDLICFCFFIFLLASLILLSCLFLHQSTQSSLIVLFLCLISSFFFLALIHSLQRPVFSGGSPHRQRQNLEVILQMWLLINGNWRFQRKMVWTHTNSVLYFILFFSL